MTFSEEREERDPCDAEVRRRTHQTRGGHLTPRRADPQSGQSSIDDSQGGCGQWSLRTRETFVVSRTWSSPTGSRGPDHGAHGAEIAVPAQQVTDSSQGLLY